MNRQSWLVLVAGLALIGGAALFLATLHSRQRLGQPGVKVVNVPTYGRDEKGTNTSNEF